MYPLLVIHLLHILCYVLMHSKDDVSFYERRLKSFTGRALKKSHYVPVKSEFYKRKNPRRRYYQLSEKRGLAPDLRDGNEQNDFFDILSDDRIMEMQEIVESLGNVAMLTAQQVQDASFDRIRIVLKAVAYGLMFLSKTVHLMLGLTAVTLSRMAETMQD